MPRIFDSGTGRKFLFVFIVVAVAATIFLLPRSATRASKNSSLRTESHVESLSNYDIRTDKHAIEAIASFRTAAGKNAALIADTRETMARGEAKLKQRVPTLKVEYNIDLQIPEVIAPDVKQGARISQRIIWRQTRRHPQDLFIRQHRSHWFAFSTDKSAEGVCRLHKS